MSTATTQTSVDLESTECRNVIIHPHPAQTSTPSMFREVAKDIASSVVGSAMCIYSGQPFDTLKVRLQVQTNAAGSAFKLLRQSIQNEGVRSLWKGSVPAFAGALAENAVAFATNGYVSRLLAPIIDVPEADKHQEEINFKGPMISGAITGAITATVLCPFDILKCRAQTEIAHGHANPRMSAMAGRILGTFGPKGFYVGFGAQLLREIPFFALFFGSYEVSCQLLRKHTTLNDPTVYVISGGLAGQAAWAGTMAADSIKSIIQTSSHPMTIAQTAKYIYTHKGLRGFYAGMGVVLLRAFPANAALFVGYEYTKKVLAEV